METAFGQYDEVCEPEACERAVAWSTAIGLQRVDGLEVSDYLRETARRHVAGEITQAEVKAKIAEQILDTSAEGGAVFNPAADQPLTTAKTEKGLIYILLKGDSLDSLTEGAHGWRR